jgi:predicted DNA-binding antitoxin AbrB/MazE fold protein
MQIEAIYEHGRLEFTRPVRFKDQRVRVLVEVPEDAIVEDAAGAPTPAEVSVDSPKGAAGFADGTARGWLRRLEELRAQALREPDGASASLKQAQAQAWDAFASREDR